MCVQLSVILNVRNGKINSRLFSKKTVKFLSIFCLLMSVPTVLNLFFLLVDFVDHATKEKHICNFLKIATGMKL